MMCFDELFCFVGIFSLVEDFSLLEFLMVVEGMFIIVLLGCGIVIVFVEVLFIDLMFLIGGDEFDVVL